MGPVAVNVVEYDPSGCVTAFGKVTPVVGGLADIVTVYPEKGFRDELTTVPVTEIAMLGSALAGALMVRLT